VLAARGIGRPVEERDGGAGAGTASKFLDCLSQVAGHVQRHHGRARSGQPGGEGGDQPVGLALSRRRNHRDVLEEALMRQAVGGKGRPFGHVDHRAQRDSVLVQGPGQLGSRDEAGVVERVEVGRGHRIPGAR